ncbi:DEAD/DEAH box helicase [Actinopolymorpha cephalotaxi]|uniref:DEAD/DEAH box helicase domain-containing protein n=1 Tax=Actinopolymorpha cephalotaxi TaxID=504797 RepID=A0ABX2S9U2_9ACTN|nr:DEAD/DEAH box helicase domain-containing protein [Actinopolymorpha cephalotaxi]
MSFSRPSRSQPSDASAQDHPTQGFPAQEHPDGERLAGERPREERPAGERPERGRGASAGRATDPAALLDRLTLGSGRADRVTHVEHVPARQGRTAEWPSWVPRQVLDRLSANGIQRPWTHQALAAQLARDGEHVVLATGTASGKSLGYLLPVLSEILAGPDGETTRRRTGTALYLSPTKALAADQFRAVGELAGEDSLATTCDGDSGWAERDWARDHAAYILTNPDMLHRSILPAHARWARFLGSLRYVVVDECHHYRGVFGSHVAQVLRRLRRIVAHYGADPTFVLASATVSEPAGSAARLTGVPVRAVAEDASPHGGLAFALWEPPFTRLTGEGGAPVRRSATAETADLLADLVADGVRTVAFIRSRRGAEVVAVQAREHLAEVAAELPSRVAAYRAGYLPEERRALERALQNRRLLGVAATNALELGVDIAGLDAVLVAGYPGTRASLWQQAGRAGRDGQGALAVFVARDDPLDTYLVQHPDAVFGPPVEATVLDPDNPYVVKPHVAAAAAELPITDADIDRFGPSAPAALQALEAEGMVRRRPHGWFWTRRGRASDLADIRSVDGQLVRVVEGTTGRLLGTVDAGAAHTSVHDGAVYLHQGATYVVDHLDLEAAVALVERAEPDYSTTAREITDIEVLESERGDRWGEATLDFGSVKVENRVVAYLRRRLVSGEVLGEVPLTLPPRTLQTRAVWWTVSEDQLVEAGLGRADVGGAAHAAEHAAIGLLPLFATCDRWDVGGVSTALHPDTGRMTVFVYDGHPGGAGFAERGFTAAARWLGATRDAIAACHCADGCPSCVHSPKCGNGNNPLDKSGAVRLLDVLLNGAPPEARPVEGDDGT